MHNVIYWILVVFAGFLVLVCVFELLRNIEHIFATFVKKQVPWVPSIRPLRRAIINEICAHYPNAKTAVEAGAGFGGLARLVARKCDMRVYAIENMPFCLALMWVANKVTLARNVVIIPCDLFKYLAETDKHFDIGIAYMGPGVNNMFAKFADKFDVFITLDAPIRALKPVRTVDLSQYGFTRWHGEQHPHKMFVYEFAKNPRK